MWHYACPSFAGSGVRLSTHLQRIEYQFYRDFDWRGGCLPPAGYLVESGSKNRHHVPFSEEVLWSKEPIAAAIFREPSQRLMSAYSAKPGLHADGMSHRLKKRLKDQCSGKPECYARFPGVANCVTKMLLGHHCGGGHTLRPGEAAEAAERVRTNFSFVGLTSCLRESVCLFHRLYGAAPRPAEFATIRSNDVRAACGGDVAVNKTRGWYDTTPLEGFVDTPDEGVYAAALEIFEEQVGIVEHEVAAGRAETPPPLRARIRQGARKTKADGGRDGLAGLVSGIFG